MGPPKNGITIKDNKLAFNRPRKWGMVAFARDGVPNSRSFLCKRESTSRTFRNAASMYWIPAFAGMTCSFYAMLLGASAGIRGAAQNIKCSHVTASPRSDKVQNSAAGFKGTLEHTPRF